MVIKSSVRNYEVFFHSEFAACLEQVAQIAGTVTLVDAKVYELYQPVIDAKVRGPLIKITALEENKTFEKVGDYILDVLAAGCKKNSHLVVIGGGILQDIGGFIASILFRGIEWTLIPTTVLAQCDSCIGSKTSMNIAKYKNQLGTFYPPRNVLISSSVLKTLTPGDVLSGACEAIKLAMIEGPAAMQQMKEALAGGLTQPAFEKITRQSLEIKKVYIEEDEYDRGRRNLLNYGHTFGHAFESVSKYEIPHGIAVGLGMEAANFFSWKRGLITESQYVEARDDLKPWCGEHRRRLSAFKADELMGAMKTDKKNTANQIGFILTEGYGKMLRQHLSFEESRMYLEEFLKTLD